MYVQCIDAKDNRTDSQTGFLSEEQLCAWSHLHLSRLSLNLDLLHLLPLYL